MRFHSHQPTAAIFAVLAVLSLSISSSTSSTSSSFTDAHPLHGHLSQPRQLSVRSRFTDLRKRQLHVPPLPAVAAAPPAETKAPLPEPVVPTTHPKPPPTQPSPPTQPHSPDPSPTPKPEPPTPQPSPTKPKPSVPNPPPAPAPEPHTPSPNNPAPAPSKATHSSASNSSSSVVSPTPSSTGPSQPSPSPGEDDGNGVPTKVSEKVFIGLGTVGGLLIFALGGIAFCRQRRKKNLATELLKQTAQFNHNNPYAKISEVNKSNSNQDGFYAKESLAMMPTKPLGTFGVVAIYTPALADEIELGLGDSVSILQQYDDGWCMGVNNTRGGIKGVFPRHCLEGQQFDNMTQSQYGGHSGGEELGYYPPNPGFKAMANKRMSSIPSQGWGGGGPVHGYTTGSAYGDYPPSPHYNNNNNNGGPPNGYYQGGY